MNLFFSDYLIFFISIFLWTLFIFLWTDKVYRFYFWVIFWFLLFLAFNLEIKILELEGNFRVSFWEDFLLQNKDFILSFFSSFIPIFWLLFIVFSKPSKNSIVFSVLFWLFLPIFLLWIFNYILNNSALKLEFLEDILSSFENSFIFEMFDKSPYLIFLLLFFVIFWRTFFTLIFWIIWAFLACLKKKKEEGED